MKRRNALQTLSFATGGSLILPTIIFSACQSDAYQPIFFTKKNVTLLNEIGETILPATTDSPGAKSLNVAHFMDIYVADCYTLEQQQIVKKGLIAFQKECQKNAAQSFMDMSPSQKYNWLVNLDKTASQSKQLHYFSLLKSLVLFGYFTSKEGANQALRYVPIPGKYEGDYPFQSGDKAWALG